MSLVWKIFEVDKNDATKVDCVICQKKLIRGGADPRKRGTSNMLRHLEKGHPEKFRELKKAQEEKQDG